MARSTLALSRQMAGIRSSRIAPRRCGGEIRRAVLAAISEGREIMRLSGQWQRKLQNREIFFAHTSQKVPPLKDYRHFSPALYYVLSLNKKIKVELLNRSAAKEVRDASSNVAA